MDLMACAEASQDEQILGRARDVCKSIDIMVGHTARTANQERFWPASLDKMKANLEYDHVLLKSDYWKKFEGTVMKQGKGSKLSVIDVDCNTIACTQPHIQSSARVLPSSL